MSPSSLPSLRVSFILLSVGCLIACSTPVVAAPTTDLATMARYLPENTRVVLSVRMNPEVREWLLTSFPMNPEIYKKLATEQAQQFAKATGFDPMQDVESLVMAIGERARGAPPSALLIARVKGDAVKLGNVLGADPKLTKSLRKSTVKGTTILTAEEIDFAFLPRMILIGTSGALTPLLERTADSASNTTFLGGIPGAALENSILFLSAQIPTALRASAASNSQVTQVGGGILARLQHVSVALDDKDVTVVFQLDSKDAAQVGSDQLKGMLTTTKGILEGMAKPVAGDKASPIEYIHPRALLGRVAALSGLQAVNSAQISVDSEQTRLSIPKDKIPVFKGGMSVFLVGMALAAGTVVGAAQQHGSMERDTCFANQRLLTGALELYNADKKKQAKLEDVAGEQGTGKYLPEGKPDDPGQGSGSFKNYATLADGTVYCKVHGRPEAPVVTPPPIASPSPQASPGANPKASPSPKTAQPDKNEGSSGDEE